MGQSGIMMRNAEIWIALGAILIIVLAVTLVG
jgi:hypothetical protein